MGIESDGGEEVLFYFIQSGLERCARKVKLKKRPEALSYAGV